MSILAIKDKHEDSLMELPNVAGVAIGEKHGEPIIKVFVVQKVPIASLEPHEIIPKQLEGYEIEVEEIGIVSIQN